VLSALLLLLPPAGGAGPGAGIQSVGITAVVAAVTDDSSSRRAQEQACAAETVLHELEEPAGPLMPPYPASPDGGHSPRGSPSSGPGGAGGAAAGDAGAAALRSNKRKLYPVGRILHLLPADVVTRAQQQAAGGAGGGAAAAAAEPGAPEGGQQGQGQRYLLMESPDPTSYGRVKLCRTMVLDHFIPSYIKSLDTVIASLEEVAAGG
jgi:hypothetical protein